MPAPPTQQQWPVPGVSYVAGYPTPNQRDFFVYVYRNMEDRGFVLPVYGDAHPDMVRYPLHKVTLVRPDEEQGRGWWIIVYAKDLEPQDAENFSVEYPYGPANFPRITRNYILPRAQWLADGPLALGTADPQVDVEGNPLFPDATLVESDTLVQQTGDPRMDALYVKVRRVFEHIPNLADAEDLTAAKLFGYKIEYPYSDTSYSRVTWTVPASATTTAAYGSACPIAGHTSNVLIEQQYVREKGTVVGVTRVYEILPSPWQTSTALDEDGDALTTKKRLQTGAGITTGETLSGGTWTRTTKEEINSYYGREVVVTRAIPGTTTTRKAYDALTDTTVSETHQLIAASTADYDYTGLTNLQDYRDIPVGSVVKMRIIRTYPAGITSKTFVEYGKERFTYPALLSSFGSSALGSIRRTDGTTEFYVNPVIEGERPRTIASRITTVFVTSLSSLPAALAINPQRLSRRGPLFTVTTGPVLCNSQTITATIPSGDPVYDSGVVDTYTITASSPTRDAWVSARSAGSYFVLDFDAKRIANGLWMLTSVELPYL